MKKFTDSEIIDVVRYSERQIIVVEKRLAADLVKPGSNYYLLNLDTGDKEAVTAGVYYMKKFGASSYKKISEQITSAAQCEAVIMPSRDVFVIFPNGQCGLFSPYGELQWTKTLTYNDKEVNALAADGDYIWCCCRDEDCVLRYSTDNFKVDLRIGGKGADTFRAPNFLSADEDSIYVCCNNRKLRRIDRSNFTVSDVSDGIPQLQKFYRFGKYSLLCTADGAYLGEDE